MIKPTLRALRRLALQLRHDRSGLALLEFAYAMPVVLVAGLYGVETANLALTNTRLSQIALNLADNASRVGATNTLAIQQLREVDVNDILTAVRLQGASIGLTDNGRITLSSLENVQQSYDAAPVQRIHWQRCLGVMSGSGYDSTYGATTTNAGTDATQNNAGLTQASGIGDAGSLVSAPSGAGLMFVEINYLYHPITSSWLMPASRIHYIASFIVRDPRDFSQIFNPTPSAARATCDKHTSS
ncbi:MAG: hypothetical protein WC816_06860 [Sphingomonas sp.]